MPLPILPTWVAGYIAPKAVSFVELGRGMDGADCWGLLRLVLMHEAGVDVPAYGGIGYEDSACDPKELMEFMAGEIAAQWAPIWERTAETPKDAIPTGEQVFDGLWLRPHGRRQTIHVGVVVKPGWMLHVEHGCDACVESYRDDLRWRHRVMGVYRHASLRR